MNTKRDVGSRRTSHHKQLGIPTGIHFAYCTLIASSDGDGKMFSPFHLPIAALQIGSWSFIYFHFQSREHPTSHHGTSWFVRSFVFFIILMPFFLKVGCGPAVAGGRPTVVVRLSPSLPPSLHSQT